MAAVSDSPAADPRVTAVPMPKWGLSMRSGKITSWLVSEGDAVSAGDELADIDTDKITGSLEAADGGVVRRLVAKTGDDVPVGAAIALLAPADVPDSVLDDLAGQARAVIDAGVPDADADGGPAVETAEAGGRKISYAGAGPAESGGSGGSDDDVVLMVHGYGGDRNSWLFLQSPLSERRWVYALDLPGHGTSSKDVGDGGVDVLADAVAAVLDATGAPRAHLVGHSLGGAVALAVADRVPGRAASVTLFAPAGFGSAINAGYIRDFAASRSRRELKPVASQLFADDSLVTRQLLDDLLAYKRLDGVSEALSALSATLLAGEQQRLDCAGLLRSVSERVPVTVVWGASDQILPSSAAQAAGEAAPRAVVRVIDGAGHMVHMERPAESQAAIEETIDRAR